jgi:two-component system invasion response regulator UvrY
MINVLVADDHAVVRRGLKQILSETRDMRVSAEAGNAETAVRKALAEDVHVLVLDITMPGRSGLEVLKELQHYRPDLPVLVLSVHAEEQFAVRVLKAGASGFLAKESAPEELVSAIRKVLAGGKYVSASLAETLATRIDAAGDQPPHAALSDREFQVMRMLAAGKTPTQIASDLALSVKTISTYRARVLEKMGFTSTAEIMRYAIENQLSD